MIPTKGPAQNRAYAPRRSQNVASNLAPSDGDLWQEKLAVCEGTTPQGEPNLLIRSFYRNGRTGERVWDEPPSGAGSVIHATSAMRKKAEMQKEELHLTLEMIPPETEQISPNEMNKEKKEKGFLRRFRSKKKEKVEVETSKDLNLQRAIARSIADQNHSASGEPIVHYDGENDDNAESYNDGYDEEIAFAKALSISEAEAALPSDVNTSCDSLTEEEMFQRALEHSQKDSLNKYATGVASLPTCFDDESMSSFSVSVQPNITGKRDPNESSIALPE
jgi:hypothetical protein